MLLTALVGSAPVDDAALIGRTLVFCFIFFVLPAAVDCLLSPRPRLRTAALDVVTTTPVPFPFPFPTAVLIGEAVVPRVVKRVFLLVTLVVLAGCWVVAVLLLDGVAVAVTCVVGVAEGSDFFTRCRPVPDFLSTKVPLPWSTSTRLAAE